MIRYAITDREYTAAAAQHWSTSDVNFVQLRDKTLEAGALLLLAQRIRDDLSGTGIRLLINGRCDVAVAANAAGVHLTSHPQELTPQQVRAVFANAGHEWPIVSISCHTLTDVERARDNKADLILFGPVFEKRVAGELVAGGKGLGLLQKACVIAHTVPVLALGGVTPELASQCIDAGAGGWAAIRGFKG